MHIFLYYKPAGGYRARAGVGEGAKRARDGFEVATKVESHPRFQPVLLRKDAIQVGRVARIMLAHNKSIVAG
jgi:hypothetical protein